MRQYIIFDLEATCWPGKTNQTNEIIEIGAVKLDESANQLSSFQSFVKPSKNPLLSDFCKELTHISQDQVDDAPCFSEAMIQFENWIQAGEFEETLLLSWGDYDRNQIVNESRVKNYQGDILKLLKHHENLKKSFAVIKQVKRCGMARALEIMKIPLEGTHHRGIDDAKNIAKIFKGIYPKWCAVDINALLSENT